MTFSRYRKKTQYDTDKTNKSNNFKLLNEKYCKLHQTVLAGDSITEIFNMELFDEYIATSGQLVYNRGISGDTTDRFLERIDESVLKLQPKNLVLLIGTNDLTLISDVDYVYSNIEKAIDKALCTVENCKIIIQSVYPTNEGNKRKSKCICDLNNRLNALANDKNLVYLDVYSKLADENGGFKSAYTYDGLHPNAQGFEIVAEEIIKVIS